MIIFRYISKEIYTTFLAILLVLLMIFITNQFIHYLNYVAHGNITMGAMAKLMALQTPFLLGYLIPLSFYLAILIAFGRLYLDHEMTVLGACGVSPSYLFSIIFSLTLVITVIVSLLMLWIQPSLDDYRLRIFYESAAQATVEKVMPKRFQNIGEESVFYAERIKREAKEMENIFLAQHDSSKSDHQSWDITVAKTAEEREMREGRFMLFKEGYRYIGIPGKKNYQIVQFKEYGIKLLKQLHTHSGWPSNAPTRELWLQRYTSSKAAAELHWRIAIPISVAVLTLLAFPLSRVNPRRGKFTQLLPAILLFIFYENLLFVGRVWIRKEIIGPDLGLWWIHGLMILIALFLLGYRHLKHAHS